MIVQKVLETYCSSYIGTQKSNSVTKHVPKVLETYHSTLKTRKSKTVTKMSKKCRKYTAPAICVDLRSRPATGRPRINSFQSIILNFDLSWCATRSSKFGAEWCTVHQTSTTLWQVRSGRSSKICIGMRSLYQYLYCVNCREWYVIWQNWLLSSPKMTC